MLADGFSNVLALETPTKSPFSQSGPNEKTAGFYVQAQECLENFLACEDLSVIFQIRKEFEEFCAKVSRSLDSLHFQTVETSLVGWEKEQVSNNLRQSITHCQRVMRISCEYNELKSGVLSAVEQELEDLQDLLFQITEHKLSPNSRLKPAIGQLYNKIKGKMDPVNASIQFVPLRIECYRLSAQPQFQESVLGLITECSRLEERVRSFIQEFSNVDKLLKSEWWDPVFESVLENPISKPALTANVVLRNQSSIPVLNLRVKGQRKSLPPQKFVSRIPKPTEVLARPRSLSMLPDRRRSLGHQRTSSQLSNCSTISQDSIPSPVEQSFGFSSSIPKPKLFEHAPVLLPPSQLNRPESRLKKPTLVDLSRTRSLSLNKENDESFKPHSLRPPSRLSLTTIDESPNRLSSSIPKFFGSPAVRKPTRMSQLYETPIR